MLKTVDDVIDTLGGPTKTGALVGVGASAVINWRTRREIPADCFLLISDALASLGEEAPRSVFGFKEAVDEART